MCGIAGLVTKAKHKNETIKKMSDRIIHRGPDGYGFFMDEEVALAHRRLSIIDLEGGAQPMYNEDGSICLVFNGEIYNYRELAARLKDCGHRFSSQSDTEVLIHGYEEWGVELPEKLRGMFAFAIYDKNTKELFLARDHFGIKPLYYAQMNGAFFFASEIKAFLEVPEFRKELNEEILQPFLEFSFVPTTETFFKGVYRLDAGHTLTYKEQHITLNRYFYLRFEEGEDSYEEAVDRIAAVMEDSVKKHLIADVEVGALLSGGVDSSYLVSLARPNRTYTVGYDLDRYSEIGFAEDLADQLCIFNSSMIIGKEQFFRIFPKALYHLDEPTGDPAAISLFFAAELAAREVKAVLSGEGADEFFGGYNYYKEVTDTGFYNRIPYPVRHGISTLASHLPEMRGINFLVRRGQKPEEGYVGVNRNFSSGMAGKVLKNPGKLQGKDVAKPVFHEFSEAPALTKMQAVDINFWLIKDILLKADRMTMANSLEGRVPFVDIEVFKAAATLSLSKKVTRENTKVALRDAAKRVIPNDSYKKKKLGFPVPIREWIREADMIAEINRAFDTDVSRKYFHNKRIHKLYQDHLSGKRDNYRKVWTLYCFIRWYEIFFEDGDWGKGGKTI